MIRSLQLSSIQLPWPQLVAQLPLPCSSLLANLQSGTAKQAAWARGYSAEAKEDNAAELDLQQAARELGLDAMRLPQLQEMMAKAMHKDTPDNSVIGVDPAPAKQKKLTYSDVQGYEQLLQSLVFAPDDYKKQMPKAPALDAGLWVDAHFKQLGYGLEPRGPFYVWRAWAAAALPQEQVETLIAMESVMGDDSQRSALLKQAQHELARYWDWQHRRAALGLPMDLPRSSSSSSAIQQETAAAADTQQMHAAAAVEEADSSSSSSSSDDELSPITAAAAAAAELEAAAATVSIDVSDKQNVLEVLQVSGAIEAENKQQQQQPGAAQQFGEALHSSDDATAAAPLSNWMFAVEDVVSTHGSKEKAARANLEQRVAAEQRLQRIAVEAVQNKLRSGDRGRFRTLLGGNITLRKYQPVAHDDDLFLPGKPLGSAKIAAQLDNPSKTQPVDPNRVVRQAVAITEAAKHAAVLAAQSPAAALGFSGSPTEGAEWTSMPLLDRGVLHQEKLQQEERRLAAKPKMTLPWQLLPLDDYTFDLQARPPTQTLDLLTNYLEVKYADVLLRKDTVHTLQKQMAIAALTNSSSTGSSTEFLETPPAVLTAAKTLSPAEREGIIQAIDDMLHNKQYGRYKEAVLQLYCDGFVSWGELQQCWAAAQAGEELTAAAEGPVTFADDRQQLFALLSGQQQFGSLSSSSSEAAAAASQITAADEAAAQKLWTEAGSKLQNTWAAAAAAAAAQSSSSSSSSDKADKDVWAEPVSFEEAKQTWQQLLQLAGMSHDGPRFEQVLLVGSSSSSAAEHEQLQQQLQKLQHALEQATGLSVGSSSATKQEGTAAAAAAAWDVLSVDSFDQLQQLFADPPKLEDLLKQHWEQVSRKELGKKNVEWAGTTWQQLWQLLQALTSKQPPQQQQQGADTAAAVAATADVAAVFNQYLKEAEAVPLTPPPYPGARRLLRWEQRIILGPTSGQVVTSAEVKVKLSVAAAELQQETGLSDRGLQHLLRVAGSRYNAATGILSLSCDRFPTREENRRWCLEVLHRLLHEGQAKYPSKAFLLGPGGAAAAAAQAAALQ